MLYNMLAGHGTYEGQNIKDLFGMDQMFQWTFWKGPNVLQDVFPAVPFPLA